MNKNLNIIDLFAGCGGLAEGFEASGGYNLLAAVEWEKSPRDTLAFRMQNHWGMKDAEERILHFDLQRLDQLFKGWTDDPIYGSNQGLDKLIGPSSVDVIIGGPPCQAYSIAGRIRDENGMRYDYRNYLFESYLEVIKRYKPKAFIFENVPGLLTAKPNGIPISTIIQKSFDEAGWIIPDNLRDTQIDMSEYGLPQKRKRLIILGLSKSYFSQPYSDVFRHFYGDILPAYKESLCTVYEAIGDLPKLLPIENNQNNRVSHTAAPCHITDHTPRFHNQRDVETFRTLAEDIRSGKEEFTSTEKLKNLYTKLTGKKSNIHKYHVIRNNLPSNLIPAHLNKDGLRHIHPDPEQARSITIREAARLQGFPDNFIFKGSQGDKYKMIGNAVPPSISKKIADALKQLINEAALKNL